ncbi:MAG TPA: YciI family protein [Kofleriaceae bacterium]
MMLMHPGPKGESGQLPDAKVVAQMMKYNEELQQAGVLLALDGLQASNKGARVRLKGGKKVVTDGPFSEAKELVGGYWMIQVRTRDEALEWLKRIPLGDESEFVELRQVFEMADFSPELQDLAKPLADKLK